MVLTQDCNPVLRIFNMASSMENMCGFTLEDRTCFTVTVATADGCSISNEKHYYYIYSIKSANDSQPSLKMNNEKIANIGQPVATCMREDDGFNTDSVYMINTTAVITANNEKFKMRFTVSDCIVIEIAFETITLFFVTKCNLFCMNFYIEPQLKKNLFPFI